MVAAPFPALFGEASLTLVGDGCRGCPGCRRSALRVAPSAVPDPALAEGTALCLSTGR